MAFPVKSKNQNKLFVLEKPKRIWQDSLDLAFSQLIVSTFMVHDEGANIKLQTSIKHMHLDVQ